MRTIWPSVALACLAVLSTGCSTAPENDADDTGTTNEVSGGKADAGDSSGIGIKHITSCDQVEAVVASYIENLVPSESNKVDEWGVSCDWEMAENETDFANNRAVSVSLVPVEPGTPQPDPSLVVKTGGEAHEDDWVSANGGIAYSMGTAVSVAGAAATTVWLPGVEAQVAGSQWGAMPALEGAAAIEVVKSLVGNAG